MSDPFWGGGCRIDTEFGATSVRFLFSCYSCDGRVDFPFHQPEEPYLANVCVWWCDFLILLCVNPALSVKILTFLGLVLLKISHVQINPFQMVTHTQH